jgi:hypothetical protein
LVACPDCARSTVVHPFVIGSVVAVGTIGPRHQLGAIVVGRAICTVGASGTRGSVEPV